MTAGLALRKGDKVRILHTCADHEPRDGTFAVERVTKLTDGRVRLRMTRCDGSPMECLSDEVQR